MLQTKGREGGFLEAEGALGIGVLERDRNEKNKYDYHFYIYRSVAN